MSEAESPEPVAATTMEPGRALEPAGAAIEPTLLPMLPGEVRPHPSPFQYVIIAVILVVLTALEITTSYLVGDIPKGLVVTLLLVMMVVKFSLVAAWYMHLRTDKPMFRRFFAVGIGAAIVLYSIALTSLHVFTFKR